MNTEEMVVEDWLLFENDMEEFVDLYEQKIREEKKEELS